MRDFLLWKHSFKDTVTANRPLFMDMMTGGNPKKKKHYMIDLI